MGRKAESGKCIEWRVAGAVLDAGRSPLDSFFVNFVLFCGYGSISHKQAQEESKNSFLRQPHVCWEPSFRTVSVLADYDSSLTADGKPDNW